jgi:hypothetical protein
VVVAVVAGEGVCAELDGGEEGGEDNGRSEGAKLAVGEEKWWGGYGRFWGRNGGRHVLSFYIHGVSYLLTLLKKGHFDQKTRFL